MTTPATYSVHVDIEPRFRDTDAMGHVNNAVFVTYLEVGRQAYWKRVTEDVYDTVPFVIAHIDIDLRSPVTIGEIVRVALSIEWVSRSSFGMRYRLTEAASGRLVAEARTVAVTYDWDSESSIPVPAPLRQRFEEIEGRRLPAKKTW